MAEFTGTSQGEGRGEMLRVGGGGGGGGEGRRSDSMLTGDSNSPPPPPPWSLLAGAGKDSPEVSALLMIATFLK